VEEGRLHDIVDSTFGLDDVADAHRHMEADAATGKVVGLL
jgi:NADPH:quinone reductase-like Zn-dependent oxidoreductase